MQTRSMDRRYIVNPNIDPVLVRAFRNTPCGRFGPGPVVYYPTQFKDWMSPSVYYHYANDHQELQQIWAYLSGGGPETMQEITNAMLASASSPNCTHSTFRLYSYISENIRRLIHISIHIGSIVTVTE